MNEIKPVYQTKDSFCTYWVEVDEDRYNRHMVETENYEGRILYPAAAYEALKQEFADYEEIACSLAKSSKDKIEALQKENAELKEDLQFVERWANHHGTKPNVTAQEALSCIQHYPSIAAITKGYENGVIPATRNPYAENAAQAKRIAELEELIKFSEVK